MGRRGGRAAAALAWHRTPNPVEYTLTVQASADNLTGNATAEVAAP